MNRYTATVQGWGEDNDGNVGIDLTQVDLTIRKRSICNKKYQNISPARIRYWFPNLTISSMFCAETNIQSNAGTCYGDSGGPTIIKYRKQMIMIYFDLFSLLEMMMEYPIF